MKMMSANRIAPGWTPRLAASHLGLFCLPMSLVRAGPGNIIEVNLNFHRMRFIGTLFSVGPKLHVPMSHKRTLG